MLRQRVRGIAPDLEHYYEDRGPRKAGRGERADETRTAYLPAALRADRASDADYLAGHLAAIDTA
jgi:hypothetical protein